VFTSPHKIELPTVPLTEYITENFDKFGDKPALVDGPTGRTIKYSELSTRIGTVAQGFAARGVQDGDVVDLHLPNMPE
jgi:non-ribosomal peptide synthetase component E (peptide arylation enzyme)